jgi:methylmalonyl-CoA mutase
MDYEHKKHGGSLPIIGVNTFIGSVVDNSQEIEMARATDTEKSGQLERLQCFHDEHSEQAAAAQTALKQAVSERQNGFAALMEAVRHCSLGQITDAFFEVGGQYRRSM